MSRRRTAAWLVLVLVGAAGLLAWWLPRHGTTGSEPSHVPSTGSGTRSPASGTRTSGASSSSGAGSAGSGTATASAGTTTGGPACPGPACTPAPSATPAARTTPDGTRNAWRGTVTHVDDGDTIDVTGPRGVVRVRLLGIDAPELAHGSPAQCGAQTAKVALRTLAQDRQVTVIPDSVGDVRDRFGRQLAYVELGTTDLGLSQVQQGLAEAWAPASAVTPSRLPAYRAAQSKARAAGTGSWRTCRTIGR